MKRILQDLKNGEVVLAEVPRPRAREGMSLFRLVRPLVSLQAQERMLTEFGSASLMGKARQQPERFRQVLAKIKTDGFLPTFETVFSWLDEPLALDYGHYK